MQHKFVSSIQFFKNLPKPVYLFSNIWKEGTTALIHAPREVDKSSAALDIAASLARQGRPVAYVNAEGRLDDIIGRHSSAENLYVFTPEYESPDDTTDYADLVIAGIEEAVATTDIRTFVIDSVTRIAALSFGRNASAAYVMKRLVALQVRCKLSLLVVSPDSTRATDRALLNLADSEILMPEPSTDESAQGARPDMAESSDLSSRSKKPVRSKIPKFRKKII